MTAPERNPSAGLLTKLVVIEPSPAKTEHVLVPGSYSIGRYIAGAAQDVHIPLSGHNISRRHAKLTVRDDGQCELVDTDSKNGTYVNGLRINSIKLATGDVIALGNYKLLFVQEGDRCDGEEPVRPSMESVPDQPTMAFSADSVIELVDAAPALDIGKAIVRPVEDAMEPIDDDRPIDANKSRKSLHGDAALIDKKMQMLSALYQASKALISATSLDDLLEKVMDLAFENLAAQRGVIIMVDEKSGEWIPKKIRYSETAERGVKIVLSRSIAGMAMRENKAVLVSDVLLHPKLGAQESVQLLGIKSAMCVPLTHLGSVLGLIYLDTAEESTHFTKDELDMMTALGHHAAIAIRQAQLNERIRTQDEFRRKMARYHSPAVIEKIMEGSGDALQVQQAVVTVLFADITDFTVFCDKHEPEVVRDMLNEYLSEMTEVIFRREGTLDKYIADEVLAVFGVPFPHTDDPERALLTALEIREAIARLNETKKPDMRFQVKIGVNTGRVLVGDIGCLKRMDYTVLGDPVNVAKRIETAAMPDQILVGESTFSLVNPRGFNLRPARTIRLKGKAEPVMLYELMRALPLRSSKAAAGKSRSQIPSA